MFHVVHELLLFRFSKRRLINNTWCHGVLSLNSKLTDFLVMFLLISPCGCRRENYLFLQFVRTVLVT